MRKNCCQRIPTVRGLLESYADAIHITAACEGLQDFEEGFKLGVLLMLDVMTTE